MLEKFDWWLGTSTVEGLVRRGELTYSEYREGKNGSFPIVAKLAETTPKNEPTES